ncbi:GNAT family N-acetyltransferase [Bacillus cereus]|nr:GNAT family N-acetyltransferase [Bacillus cereus]
MPQTNNKEAYIHFVGVNPNYRKLGLAKKCAQLSLRM